jgi:type I restriction enzyme M protein
MSRPNAEGRLATESSLTAMQTHPNGVAANDSAAQRTACVAAFENWWDMYRVTLIVIEGWRDTAGKALQGFLKGLRYV